VNLFNRVCVWIVALALGLGASFGEMSLWDKGAAILGLTPAVQNSHMWICLFLLGPGFLLYLLIGAAIGLTVAYFAGLLT